MNEELKKLIARGKRAVYKTNTKVRRGEMSLIEAQAYVLPRLDNIIRYIKENRSSFVYFPNSYQLHNIARKSGLEWNEDLIKKDLRELERSAGMPVMSAGYGCCMMCGRTLTDPKSVAAGIGPVCATKGAGG